MDSRGIRETYLSFFEERGHVRLPSASLIPPPSDRSTLLVVAGMQPFKPYFLGRESPPADRVTSSQRCFRTPDIDEVGRTSRHLTFFEMLGNFSFGDYFKRDAIAFGWDLSVDGFGFDPEKIWITVFGGDDELGLGPDTEAIDIWMEQGVPRERIVELPRSENFWEAGPVGPCGPCSEMYLDRGAELGPDAAPGDDSERFLEYWNHVFMAFDLHEDGSLSELPRRNIDTGLGLERMAAIQQNVDSVYDTDLLRPLIDLAEELTGIRYAESETTTRAMRIIADHCRGMTYLLADGVVPSNEDRGYVLRRVMRRAILQGRALGIEGTWLENFSDRVIELSAGVHPELAAEHETIRRWVRSEEEGFGRTLEKGTEILDEMIRSAQEAGSNELAAEDAFSLHDTYGFPYDLTRELVAEHGISIDDHAFSELMDQQRVRARQGVSSSQAAEANAQSSVTEFAASVDASRFVGYERLDAQTGLLAVSASNGTALAKLEESPFYAEGGGQVSDAGTLRWPRGSAKIRAVHRIGDDQALEIEPGDADSEWPPGPGTSVEAEVDRAARHSTMRNHTATHLLHAALREIVGEHVRQAGSAVRPDKLRFDFTHGEPLDSEQLKAIEDRVNGWIGDARPVRWMTMSRQEAERMGAMALFGEKYGDWVRVVEVDPISRELCGGTHVSSTAEVGIFRILSEGSSSSNVRRIEAITGPVAIQWYRNRAGELEKVGSVLRSEDPVAGVEQMLDRLREMEREARDRDKANAEHHADELAANADDVGGVKVVVARAPIGNPKQLLELAKRINAQAGGAAVALGGAASGKAGVVIYFGDPAIERGLSATDIIQDVAAAIGGGGGGSDEMAQAGGRDIEGVDRAVEIARERIEQALGA